EVVDRLARGHDRTHSGNIRIESRHVVHDADLHGAVRGLAMSRNRAGSQDRSGQDAHSSHGFPPWQVNWDSSDEPDIRYMVEIFWASRKDRLCSWQVACNPSLAWGSRRQSCLVFLRTADSLVVARGR